MDEEYDSLIRNHTWDFTSLPKGRKIVQCRWIYPTKFVANGLVDKYKARLVAKGFSQVAGIDYTKTFVPVTKMTSIRHTCYSHITWMKCTSNGCEECLSSWRP